MSNKKRLIIICLIVLILLIIIAIFSFLSAKSLAQRTALKNEMKNIYNEELEEITVKKDLFGNGFFIYKVVDISDIEIHAYFNRKENTFIEDGTSRFYKYYFEKWEDENKSNFVVEESYEDYTHNFTTKKEWILNYSTYIEVNTYEEMINATNIIIKFIEYMNHPEIIINSYIKVGDDLILPHNVSLQTNEDILNSAIRQFLQ